MRERFALHPGQQAFLGPPDPGELHGLAAIAEPAGVMLELDEEAEPAGDAAALARERLAHESGAGRRDALEAIVACLEKAREAWRNAPPPWAEERPWLFT